MSLGNHWKCRLSGEWMRWSSSCSPLIQGKAWVKQTLFTAGNMSSNELMFSLANSPPVRWGLLDFMSATCRPASPPPPPPLLLLLSASSSFSCDQVCSVWRAGPQLRSCEISVPRRTSTAILWDQCSAPDLNCDPVRSVFRAGPQLRSCEISVPHRTSTDSTAILWDQCSAPDLNRDPVRSVFRAGPQPRNVSERVSEDMSERMSEDMSEGRSERMSKDMSERLSRRYAREIPSTTRGLECLNLQAPPIKGLKWSRDHFRP